MSPFTTRRLRLASGLILFTYLTTHLLNHALGLISLDAMEAGRFWFLLLWRNPVATLLLYGALLTHIGLALYSLYQRRHLRMPTWEVAQLSLGLAVPVLLAIHVAGTRISYELFGADDPYARVLLTFWVQAPSRGIRQALLVVIAWSHGCMGIHYWLRLRPAYRRMAPALLAFALLLLSFALVGYVQGGRTVKDLAADPAWTQALVERTNGLDGSQRAAIQRIQGGISAAFVTALLLVLAARWARGFYEHHYRSIRITYPTMVVTVPIGFTILEASRYAAIPHASVCGGRGRCSTCRVRINRGLRSLPRPSDEERRVLAGVGAAPDVRLACQTRPERDVAVTPLLAADAQPVDAFAPADARQGREQEVTVLFADLRGFTRMVERKLPYDVVFILNRYFEAVGTAIRRAGGVTNQFVGDGVMALFGVEGDVGAGCRQSLQAARLIREAVSALSEELADELEEPLRIGVGIHTGPAVVGRIGWGDSFYLTAVGDTVNVTARLEQATKDYHAELVVSEAVMTLAGVDPAAFEQQDLMVRNRDQPVPVRIVTRVADLEEGKGEQRALPPPPSA